MKMTPGTTVKINLHTVVRIAAGEDQGQRPKVPIPSRFSGSQLAIAMAQLAEMRLQMAGSHSGLKKWHWKSPEEFLLDEKVNSEFWRGADHRGTEDEQELIDRVLKNEGFTGFKDCFANCTKAAIVLDEVSYVEGFALPSAVPLPIHHAWLRLPSGGIIDPTWETHSSRGAEYIGVPVPDEEVASWVGGGPVGLLDYRRIERLMEHPPSWVFR